jgi:transposase-like protein
MNKPPRTLMEAIRYFADEDRTLAAAVELRWPNGVHCPTCGRTDVRFIGTRKLWECKEKHPRKQFSAKVGTIFEDSPLPLDKWFVAIWAVANCKNGISSYELSRAIGVTQKTAWHMLHRIRLAMEVGGSDKFGGIVESDETYVGGEAKNMHPAKRKARITKANASDKAAVMGILQRTDGELPSRVIARVIKDANRKIVQAMIRQHVEPGSQLMTDGLLAYRGLKADYVHEFVDHSAFYVRGIVHSNGIENFWSLLKRTIKGTYVSVDPLHLQRYLGEQAFRFNERKGTDYLRFANVVSSIVGKRLTWKDLTNHGLSAAAQ